MGKLNKHQERTLLMVAMQEISRIDYRKIGSRAIYPMFSKLEPSEYNRIIDDAIEEITELQDNFNYIKSQLKGVLVD
jgi:hypothetical protein